MGARADQPAATVVPGPAVASTASSRRRRGTRWRCFQWSVRLLVLALVVGYLKFVGLDGKFYYPDDEVYDRPDTLGRPYEDVRFATSDGVFLHGWFFPAHGQPRGTVIHFHGNAANVSAHLSQVAWVPGEGYNLLMFDYRGYGRSQGRVSRAGTVRDGHAVLDYALTRPDVRGGPIFFYGQSLGGAVAIVVAADRSEVVAVVAESTFSGYRRVAARHVARIVGWNWLGSVLARVTISAGYDPVAVVGRLSPRPLLVIAAEADEICFPELGRELYEAAGEPKEFWLALESEHLAVVSDHFSELVERVTGCFDRARE